MAVAAASILAKAHRNSELNELEQEMGLPLDRGNIEAVLRHPKATEVLRYVYINGANLVPPATNTVQGIEADDYLHKVMRESRLETYSIDFKREFPKNATNIGKVIAGMANCDGGEIYFGIQQDTRNGTLAIVGIDEPQKVEERVAGQVSKCQPPPLIESVLYIKSDGRKVLKIIVPMSNDLVYFESRYYKRISSGAEPMTKYEIDNWPDSCRRKRSN